MKVSTKGRYALRLMIDIALHSNGEYVSLKDISRRQEISVKYLEQIVSAICSAGFLKSTRGSQGGYMLAKEPRDYTLGEIIRVTEGTLSPVSCLDDNPSLCHRSSECPTLEFWKGLNKVINDYVDSITLEDIVEQQMEQLDYSI